ncbi:prophage regulatory protein [Paraburkholderia youngii]|uniref:helix-turn-helix transcriptional regulator n=1 Tax=Paraburkholderia youngii TaxID=2782701 RepID=UPI003D208908
MENAGRLLRLADVLRKLDVSKTTLYAMIAAGEFPASIRVSPNTSRWSETEVDAWLDERRNRRPRKKR